MYNPMEKTSKKSSALKSSKNWRDPPKKKSVKNYSKPDAKQLCKNSWKRYEKTISNGANKYVTNRIKNIITNFDAKKGPALAPPVVA